MNIAFVSSRVLPFRGGVESHVDGLAGALAVRGHNVTILTQHQGRSSTWRTADGVTVRAYQLRFCRDTYPFSLGLLRALAAHGHEYDIVHAHSYHALAALAGAFTHRRPFIFTPHYHGTGHTQAARALHTCYRPLGTQLFRRADTIICVSKAERALLLQDHPSAKPKAVVIPNGLAMPTGAAPRSWERRDNAIVSLGRLERYKRVDFVVRALAGMPDAHLVIVGSGRDEPRLVAEIGRLRLDRQVTMAGNLSDVALADLLASARVVVSTSEHEAFGIALLEARQAGARVVASHLPAHAEIAEMDGSGGIELWDPKTGLAGLRQLIRAALVGCDPGVIPTPPRWPDVAAATEARYQLALAHTASRSAHLGSRLGGGR
jgi:glycosyltransferase involved in cell wall biosynthesis